MEQRRLRLGDILDDYCPRERRVTNHAVVAMIEEHVKQTRCTTCDAEHEYKEAKPPVLRRKKVGEPGPDHPDGVVGAHPAGGDTVPSGAHVELAASSDEGEPSEDADRLDDGGDARDEGPVHRRLIRATLPRPEGQVPERREPDFTMRAPAGPNGRSFDGNRNNGQRNRNGRPGRQAQGQPGSSSRFGGGQPRQGAGPRAGQGQGQGQGNGGRPAGAGQGRGPRPAGGGQGRKRGR